MDSLCDVVSFGAAPALLVKALLDHEAAHGKLAHPMLDRYIFPLLVIYVSCAALRLARYNVESETGHRSFFFGMPSPGAAGCAASLVIMSLPPTHHWQDSPLHEQVNQLEFYLQYLRGPILTALPFIMLGLGILMVSRVHYQHIGDKILKGRKSLMHLLVLVIALSLIVMHHEIMLAAAFNGYMLFGLFNEIRFHLFPKHRPNDWNVAVAAAPPATGAVPTNGDAAPSKSESPSGETRS
jgi:CDP-diacylglycerol--serine O-phosphatidyltransferase